MERIAIYDRNIPFKEDEFSVYAKSVEKRFENDPEKEIVGIFIDKSTGLAKTDERPALRQLLDKCKSGEIDSIMVKSISKLSRNSEDVLKILKEVNDTETTVYFETENTTSNEVMQYASQTFHCFAML